MPRRSSDSENSGDYNWRSFSSGLPRNLGMENGVGAGNCRRIAHHPPVDRHRPVQRPLFLCRDGKEGAGREVPAIARPDRLPTGFVGAHFPLAIGSPVRPIQPPAWPAPLALFPSLCSRGGANPQGLGSLD